MTRAKIEQVEKTLKADIRWAIRNGIKWNACRTVTHTDGKWVARNKECGVCAVGAHVVRNQCPYPDNNSAWSQRVIVSAADNLGVDYAWLDDLYFAVMDVPANDDPDCCSSGAQSGHRLRDYAEAYTKRYKAEKKRKAQRS